jgi:hypothetical protein
MKRSLKSLITSDHDIEVLLNELDTMDKEIKTYGHVLCDSIYLSPTNNEFTMFSKKQCTIFDSINVSSDEGLNINCIGQFIQEDNYFEDILFMEREVHSFLLFPLMVSMMLMPIIITEIDMQI